MGVVNFRLQSFVVSRCHSHLPFTEDDMVYGSSVQLYVCEKVSMERKSHKGKYDYRSLTVGRQTDEHREDGGCSSCPVRES